MGASLKHCLAKAYETADGTPLICWHKRFDSNIIMKVVMLVFLKDHEQLLNTSTISECYAEHSITRCCNQHCFRQT